MVLTGPVDRMFMDEFMTSFSLCFLLLLLSHLVSATIQRTGLDFEKRKLIGFVIEILHSTITRANMLQQISINSLIVLGQPLVVL